jgi:cytoskeletal protein CcmA (bactofilin family)
MSRVRVPLPAPTVSSKTVSIFHRGTTPAPSDSASSRRNLTHIAAGTLLQGAVTGATELLVEGQIQGEVRVDATVTIGAEGVVEGPVAAPVVRISGRVTGNVAASDRVEVAASGILEGDVAAPRIVIAEGAFFKGRVEMRGKPSPPPAPTNP